MLILIGGETFSQCFPSHGTEKTVMMLKDMDRLIPNNVFGRQKAGRHGREFPTVIPEYHIVDICKETGKMLLAEKWNKIKNIFNSFSSKRMRQLAETP